MEVFPKAYRIDLCRGYCSKSMESAFISLEIQVSFILPNNCAFLLFNGNILKFFLLKLVINFEKFKVFILKFVVKFEIHF